jgi:two-component system, OmpR family, sensor histidine kinase RstB
VSDVLEQIAPFAPDLRPRFSAVGPLGAAGSVRHLRRAISNIVRNAQRYARSAITLDVQVDESGCRVVIDDDGPGIPVADRERLFLPFTRLDQDRNRQTGGHGLGLAIVHRVLQAHRGNAQIADSPLGGARFVLWWPAHAGKRASGYIR